MPYATTDDDVRLYYEDTGAGEAMVFVHEFAGDHRQWEPQVRYFSRRYRCITFDARGYPLSDVPEADEKYSQDRARDDIKAITDHLGIERAHIVGHSMGAFATLHFGLRYPARALSLVLAGCGYGAHPDAQQAFLDLTKRTADMFRSESMETAAAKYARSPGRLQYRAKDPRGYAEFAATLAEHSAEGSALTMANVQRLRPSLWDLQDELKALELPVLIITGDEDDPCLDPGVFMKRLIPNAGLAMVPKTGHTINTEEPALFNQYVEDFLVRASANRWLARRDVEDLS
jgi:pimeloyl-ACP methyl ester carboxylesterase